MIISRRSGTDVAESGLTVLSEQPHSITEPAYPDSIIFGWLKGVPTQGVADRMEADRRSVTRQMERAFA